MSTSRTHRRPSALASLHAAFGTPVPTTRPEPRPAAAAITDPGSRRLILTLQRA